MRPSRIVLQSHRGISPEKANSIGRAPQDEGQVPDSNKHYVSEKGLGCAAVPKVVDVSLQVRPSPISSLLLARVSTSERGMTFVLGRHSGVTQGTTCRPCRR